jgi:peptidoglycan hydrolase-like protein with peptidoglycan-binding domain
MLTRGGPGVCSPERLQGSARASGIRADGPSAYWMHHLRSLSITAALIVACACPASADARGSASVAAVQVALRALHTYGGGIDGIPGAGTRRAVRAFQRSHRLPVDGVAGPRTLRALGRRGTPGLGSRVMQTGSRGFDVAALQFLLRGRGYGVSVDGGYGPATAAAVRRFQGTAGLTADGRAGNATVHALEHGVRRQVRRVPASALSGPVRFLRPVSAPLGDGFGYPGGRRHDGIDFEAHSGDPVGAAGRGIVSFAGWNSGGYGNLVVIQHRLGFETYYAHLSSISVGVGQAVAGGSVIGAVGATGRATGPHLHFEVRLHGTPIDPAPLLLAQSSLGG